MKKILIIAGEASSDMHAANLINNIKALNSDVSFIGLGGEKMREAGVKLFENIVRFAFIGPGGLFQHYLALRKIYHCLINHIKTEAPDCAILIDYAEFNLRVAKELKALGVPVIYYISPQVWAWGLWRIKTIKSLVNKMLVFFHFEEKLYKAHGVDVSFVGHPLLDTVKITSKREDIAKEIALGKSQKIVGILPGSREGEINNILPIMLDSCKLISENYKGSEISFILVLASTVDEKNVKKIIDKSSLDVKIIKGSTHDAISLCDCALVASGTATLETALLGVPMAIIYKANFLTYIMTKNLIKLPYIGLVNVVAGEKIVAEFLQNEARPENISEYMLKLLDDEKLVSSLKEKFIKIKESLGKPGASKRAASEVVEFLKR